MSKVRSQPYHLRSMICPSTRVQTPSPTSSNLLAIPIKKGEKILRGSLHNVRGSIGLGLETLVNRRITFVYFVYNFSTLVLLFSLIFSIFVFTLLLCSIFLCF